MDIWSWVFGVIRLELISADPAAALEVIRNAGVELRQVKLNDDGMSLSFTISRSDRINLERIAAKKGYLLQAAGKSGFLWQLISLRSRPILVVGLVAIFLLSLWIPSRIFFVAVEGNTEVPTKLILEQSQENGLSFGASRRAVRSERMKNALLDGIPQLQWVGINTYGCTAVISVRERAVESMQPAPKAPVSSLIAVSDGVISRVTVTKGTQLCQVGQIVKQGQLLVSGYTDCGICIRAGQAEGEIFAQTERKLEAVTPIRWAQKGNPADRDEKFSIILGKKRINFYKGSGFSDGSCDKMYLEYYVTLPGGFDLPIRFVREISVKRSANSVLLEQEQCLQMLSQNAKHYLKTQMISGILIQVQERSEVTEDLLVLYGRYACEEMIAKIRYEENWNPNE